MSTDYPPAQQPPAPGQNPYAQPPVSPYIQQPSPQAGFNAAAYPPPTGPMATARRGKTSLGILAGVVATIALALAYGEVLRSMAHDDGSTSEFRLFALAVGTLIGMIVGKVGGRDRLLPVLAVVFALVAVVCGELFGDALIISHLMGEHGTPMSVGEICFQHFGTLWDAWKDDFDVRRAFYLLGAGLFAFSLTKRVAQ